MDVRAEYVYPNRNREETSYTFWELARDLDEIFRLPQSEFMQRINAQDGSIICEIAMRMKSGTHGFADPSNYPGLLEAVGRFSSSSQ